MEPDAYPDIHSKAAALLHSLARNHPFVDGNKRTALLALVTFYGLNGWDVEMEQDEIVELVLETAEGRIELPTIVERLTDKTKARRKRLP